MRSRRPPAWVRVVGVVVIALVAAAAAIATLGGVSSRIGPVDAHLAFVPSLQQGTRVDVPPLGRLHLSTHVGPLQLRVRVDGIRVDSARDLLSGGLTRREVEVSISSQARTALTSLVVRSVSVGLAASAVASAVVFRRRRAVLVGTAASTLALLACAGLAVLTLNPRALEEPSYTGLLTRAPDLTGGLADVQGRFSAYRDRIATLTGSVSRLYSTLSDLPQTPAAADEVRVLWVSDIHDNPEALTLMKTLVEEFDCEGVVDTGDDTDFGSDTENALLAPIGRLGVPYVVVRGNHDSIGVTQPYLDSLPNVTVLDGGATTVMAGLRWAGIGDPSYAPSSLVRTSGRADDLTEAGRRLAAAIDASREPVDVALVHEPAMATPLLGHVPLVLDGHTHRRAHRVARGTLELTQGSSGGAGLRTLETTSPMPLQMSVLHIDALTHRLVTVDDVSVAGVGESSATVDRRTAESYTISPEP